MCDAKHSVKPKSGRPVLRKKIKSKEVLLYFEKLFFGAAKTIAMVIPI